MKILYLTEDYFYSKVHHHFANSIVNDISRLTNEVTIFCLYRNSVKSKNLYSLYDNKEYKLISKENNSNLIRYKLDFTYKVAYKENSLLELIPNIRDFDLVYASTCFSDGALAYKIFSKYNIPYIIAVRGTDLSLYAKYMLHTWSIGREILIKSKSVIFISPCLRRKFINSSFSKRIDIEEVCNKSTILSNGIEEFWFERSIVKPSSVCSSYSYIYIGRFDRNKNTKRLIRAFEKLQRVHSNIKLVLVGGGGKFHDYVIKKARSNKSISYLGYISDKDNLASVLEKCNCLILPSHSETLGLVCLEALIMGLPVIFTKEQAIDGCFNIDDIGKRIDSRKVKSLMEAMESIFVSNFVVSPELDLSQFQWNNIGNKFNSIL